MLLDHLYKQKYLIFLDIEFQNFQPNNKQIYHAQELGLIIFERGKIEPIIVEHVNFPILNLKNMRLIGVEYASVNEKTEEDMKKIQESLIIKPNLIDIKLKEKLIKYIPDKKVRNILKDAIQTSNEALLDASTDKIEKFSRKSMYNYYYNRLPNEYKNLFMKQINLYKNDPLVKSRLVNPKDYLIKFNNYLKDGILIHKETTDLEAIKNDFLYYGIKGKVINNYDIAKHNSYFEKLKSASLHKSYLHLYETKIKNNPNLLKFHNKIIELINKKMKMFKPHNPLVDAFMTIWVYILMK